MTGMTSERFNGLMDDMALLQYNGEEGVSEGYREERRLGPPTRRAADPANPVTEK